MIPMTRVPAMTAVSSVSGVSGVATVVVMTAVVLMTVVAVVVVMAAVSMVILMAVMLRPVVVHRVLTTMVVVVVATVCVVHAGLISPVRFDPYSPPRFSGGVQQTRTLLTMNHTAKRRSLMMLAVSYRPRITSSSCPMWMLRSFELIWPL